MNSALVLILVLVSL